MIKVYLACALTHVPKPLFKRFSRLIGSIADALVSDGHLVKYALKDSDPQLAFLKEKDKAKLCYKWDSDMVQWADIIIAECSFPSTGMGIELQIAGNENKPIILYYSSSWDSKAERKYYETPDHENHKLQIGEGYISLMALGLPSVVEVLKYTSVSDSIELITKSVEQQKHNLKN